MNYDLKSITKFGDRVKDMLTQKSLDLINKYKDSSKSSVFDRKVNKDESE